MAKIKKATDKVADAGKRATETQLRKGLLGHG